MRLVESAVDFDISPLQVPPSQVIPARPAGRWVAFDDDDEMGKEAEALKKSVHPASAIKVSLSLTFQPQTIEHVFLRSDRHRLCVWRRLNAL